jgi:hypothetical protein
MRTQWSRSAGVFVVAITFAVAGCGSSGGSATPSLPAAGGGTTSAAPTTGGVVSSAPAGTGGGSGAVDVCQVVSQADVAPFFTTAMTQYAASPTGEESDCYYQVTPHDGTAPMEIVVVNGDQAEAQFASYTGGNEGEVPLPGIGDKAVHSPGQASFQAIKGSTFCAVFLGLGNSTHYVGMPSPDANGDLTDAAAVAYAQQLFPLCLKVFAAAGAQ